QYSVASPPLYQRNPLWGVRQAIHAPTSSCTTTSPASSGTGRASRRRSPKAWNAGESRPESGVATSGRDTAEHLVAVPGDRPLEPVAQRGPGAEAEQALRARHVEGASRLAVRHR